MLRGSGLCFLVGQPRYPRTLDPEPQHPSLEAEICWVSKSLLKRG